MKSFGDALQSILLTLWVGGLWAIGFIVAPTLFARLADRTLAGLLAGRLFTLIAWIGIACAICLIVHRLLRYRAAALKQGFFWVVLLMLALSLAGQFGVQPVLEGLRAQALPREVMESVLRDRFATWHGIASILYVVQSVLGLVLVVMMGRGK